MRRRYLIPLLAVAVAVLFAGGATVATGQADPGYWLHCLGTHPEQCTEEAPPTTTETETTTTTVTGPTTTVTGPTTTVTVTTPTTTAPEPLPDVDQARFTCSSSVDLGLVRLRNNAGGENTLTLDPGCTGDIQTIDLLSTAGGDCIKVRPASPGATDITIHGGVARCHGTDPVGEVNHLDGLQAGCGVRVALENVAIMSGFTTGTNAGFFVSGWGGCTPTQVTCDHCGIGPFSSSEMMAESYEFKDPQWLTGITNSRLCEQRIAGQDGQPAGTTTTSAPWVLQGNEVVLRSDPAYWTKCSQEALIAYTEG